MNLINYVEPVILGLLAIIGYFLKQKDAQQQAEHDALKADYEKQIALLWQKHDQDAKDLSDLRLHIASQHYVKTELDSRFDKMELAFQHGFQDIGTKLDRLNDILVERKL